MSSVYFKKISKQIRNKKNKRSQILKRKVWVNAEAVRSHHLAVGGASHEANILFKDCTLVSFLKVPEAALAKKETYRFW